MNGLSRLGGFKQRKQEPAETPETAKITPLALKARPKPFSDNDLRKIDEDAAQRGFVDRSERKKPGRKPSRRTGQIHAKVLPAIEEAFKDEALRLDMTHGLLMELVWQTYLRQNYRPDDDD